jgi:hypothetical protein
MDSCKPCHVLFLSTTQIHMFILTMTLYHAYSDLLHLCLHLFQRKCMFWFASDINNIPNVMAPPPLAFCNADILYEDHMMLSTDTQKADDTCKVTNTG